MAWRLVLDYLRRDRRVTVACGIFIGAAGMVHLAGDGTLDFTLAWSMMGVFVIGVMAPFLNMVPREVLRLPVSRRDAWRARWLMGAVVAPALITAGKLLYIAAVAVIGPWQEAGSRAVIPMGVPQLGLSAVLDVLYGGTFLGLATLFDGLPIGVARHVSDWRIKRERLGEGAWWLNAFLIAGGFWWAVLIHNLLPTDWSQVSGGTTFLFGVAIVLTVISAIHSPQIAPRSSRTPQTRPSPAAESLIEQPPAGTAVGLRLLILRNWQVGLVIWGSIAILVLLARGVIGSDETLAATYFSRYGVLPFAPAPLQPGEMPLWPILLLTGAALSLFTDLRQLRILPIGTTQLTALLVGMPIVNWLTMWGLLVGFDLLADGTWPATLRLDLLLLLCGLAAFATATLVRLGHGYGLVLLGVLAGASASRLYLVVNIASMAHAAAIGASGVALCLVSTAWLHRTLRHTSGIYRPGLAARRAPQLSS